MKTLAYLSLLTILILLLLAIKSPENNDLPVGTVIYSVLPPNDFTKANGQNWVLLTGQKKAEVETTELGKYWQKDLPDARGRFIRTMNDAQGNGADPDKARTVGNPQEDALQNHAHQFSILAQGFNGNGYRDVISSSVHPNGKGSHEHNPYGHSKTSIVPAEKDGRVQVDSETRPKNIALYLYIKIN